MNTDNRMRKNTNSPECNKEYYVKTRDTIIAKACAKVECHFCGLLVMKNNLPYHKKTQLCARTQEQQLNELARQKKALIKLHEFEDNTYN
jgi:proteasome lid subunit RPN8/RPN11